MSINEKTRRNRMFRKTGLWVTVLLALIGAGGYFLKGGAKAADVGTTFVARRGPLDITILEGGGVESEEKGEIKCEVEGREGVKILKIVDEGYQVTAQDVNDKKVLVELDTADLRNRITQQEISLSSTAATLTDAEQSYAIQVNQNTSDTMAAAQKARFARMDFDKYMGHQAAEEIVAQLGIKAEPVEDLPSQPEPRTMDASNPPQAASPTPGAPADPCVESQTQAAAGQVQSADTAAPRAVSVASIDFAKYADVNLLGDGEARQKLRELQDALQVAGKEQQQAQVTLEGTERLFKKDFVTKIDLDRDQLAHENCLLKVQKADTAYSLFQKYEFPKAAEEALSKYTEALRELDRTQKGAVSKLAQAEAKRKSAQARFNVENKNLKDLYKQLDKCKIKAPRQGLVVYGGGGELRYWRDEEQIREGASVREGQVVLTIPDMTKMCIKVKVHESYIKKLQKGQKVRITADAYPDRKLEGEVNQVGVLPDSENSWLNPDMKVYRSTIKILGQHDWIRPGMTMKAEIIVNQLNDVVYVPIQAVTPLDGSKVCYVVKGAKPEQRTVEVGEFNDEFIEVQQGIQEGEKVCLRTPAGMEQTGSSDKNKAPASKDETKTEDKAASPAPQAAK
jgi:RND family efflux transporter MFP subunit